MWQDIVGHDSVVDQFRRVLTGGRMASTFLFLGPEGVGKKLFALRLAKALLCAAAKDLMPCNRCDSCRLMDAGTHPDVDVVGLPSGKRWLPLDIFLGDREHRHQEGLCHQISLKPVMGNRRVAIIDDADHLTIESANCLLKVLEEPPPGAVIILIGTSRSRQLPTILSRAQLIRFQALSPGVVDEILAAGTVAVDAEGAVALGESHVGGLKALEEGASPGLAEFRQRFAKMMARPGFDGMALMTQIQDFVQHAGKESEAKRQYLRLAIDMVTEHFRTTLREANSTSGEPTLGIAAQNRVLVALDRCIRAEAELDRNANQATLLECWVDDLCGLLVGSRQ